MLRLGTTVSETIKKNGIKVRPNADPGLWFMFLLPLSVAISFIRHPRESSQIYKLCSLISIGMLGTSLIFVVQCARKKPLDIVRTVHLIPAALTATLCRLLLNSGLIFSFLTGLISSIGYWHLLLFIFKKFPNSFTVGEASVVVQGLLFFLFGTAINVCIATIQTPTKVMDISTLIIQVGLCTVGLVGLLTYYVREFRKPIAFYCIFFSVICVFLFGFLHSLLRQSPLLWIVSFLFEDIYRTKMVIYWITASVAASLAINYQVKSAKKATAAVRKVFHILIIAVFLPGLIYQCSLIYLASGVILGIFFAIEIFRILDIPPFGNILQSGYLIYKDEKDSGVVALTPIYLLVGCALPIWLHPAPCDMTDSAGSYLLPVMSGILSIGVGDTLAGIVGTAIGKHKWPGTCKTMEGTLGCVLGQVAVVHLLATLGFIVFTCREEVVKSLIAIVVGSLVEASTTQIDNIVLPIVLYMILV